VHLSLVRCQTFTGKVHISPNTKENFCRHVTFALDVDAAVGATPCAMPPPCAPWRRCSSAAPARFRARAPRTPHGQAAEEWGQAPKWSALVAEAGSASAGREGIPLAPRGGHARAGCQTRKVRCEHPCQARMLPVIVPCALVISP